MRSVRSGLGEGRHGRTYADAAEPCDDAPLTQSTGLRSVWIRGSLGDVFECLMLGEHNGHIWCTDTEKQTRFWTFCKMRVWIPEIGEEVILISTERVTILGRRDETLWCRRKFDGFDFFTTIDKVKPA